MCGIAGFIDFSKKSNNLDLVNMIGTLKHRGPDGFDTKLIQTKQANVGLAHARLSIIDLSTAANQPMKYDNLTIIFNGELYNFSEIKEELSSLNHTFTTTSDTEVILHAYQEWGNNCVDKFIGMFVFLIFDEIKNIVTIFRDRPGVKPFFYYRNDDIFIFGSELKPVLSHPQFKKEIDAESLKLFFKFGYVPTPKSIFKNTFKLNPGSILTIDLNSRNIDIKKYWDVKKFYTLPKLEISYEEAKVELKKLLISTVNYRMVADVPVGIFLSGGYDSTLIASLLQKNRTDKIKTFTIGFEEGNNEAPHAKKVAEYLGTNHTEFFCTTKEAQEIIKELPFFFDEPFSDSSAIPTILVSKLAKKQVTVALSADGGDESFIGYSRYLTYSNNLKIFNKIPFYFNTLVSPILFQLGKLSFLKNSTRHKLNEIAEVLKLKSKIKQQARIFEGMNSAPNFLVASILNFNKKNTSITDFSDAEGFEQTIDYALTADYKMYLQNDILTKVDRATMSASLEGREPLLDHRIIEFAARLPFNFKFNNTLGGKRILKDLVHEMIPEAIMNRPKAGFSIPIDYWLKNDLKYLFNEFLSKEEIEKNPYLNSKNIDKIKKDYFDNKLNYNVIVWRLLVFSMWYKRWFNS